MSPKLIVNMYTCNNCDIPKYSFIICCTCVIFDSLNQLIHCTY
jgi:hypothetical protein